MDQRLAIWTAAVALIMVPLTGRAQTPAPPSSTTVSSRMQPGAPSGDRGPAEREAPTAQASQAPPAARPRVTLGGLAYLSFKTGDAVAADSAFVIKRSYLDVGAEILPYFSARITPDVYADDDGIEFRLKYAYAEFRAEGNRVVSRPIVRAGMVPTPWFMFEERANRYRMQDPMFIERSGILNSADTGITVSGLLGGLLSEDTQRATGGHDPGRFGSFAFGVYNGGGYTGREFNTNKVFQARLTGRPLPDRLPGLQATWFLMTGAGNTPAAPEWRDQSVLVTWEHPRVAATAQWVGGHGNQSGAWADPVTAEAWPHRGWSAFAEVRMGSGWSAIGRFDDFNPDTRTEAGHFRRVIAGLARWLDARNCVLADVDHRVWADGGRPGETRVQVTLQIAF